MFPGSASPRDLHQYAKVSVGPPWLSAVARNKILLSSLAWHLHYPRIHIRLTLLLPMVRAIEISTGERQTSSHKYAVAILGRITQRSSPETRLKYSPVRKRHTLCIAHTRVGANPHLQFC